MKNSVQLSHWSAKFEISLAALMLSVLCLIITWGIELLARVLFRFW
ncbi:MAG: hypothetical protein ACU83O_05810 [Gammaproteobacteria bacterium]